jgi:hypothetical protein|nr:MAG TPA: putative HTH-type transcriptional regulator [Caudoviricetes sp.]
MNKFGLFCRKLRLDNRELLLDMASKLGVSSAFLSKVENGKSKPPADWESRLINLYSLDNRQRQELNEAFFEALNYKSIDIQNYSDENRDLVLTFARSLDKIDIDKREKILNILKLGEE